MLTVLRHASMFTIALVFRCKEPQTGTTSDLVRNTKRSAFRAHNQQQVEPVSYASTYLNSLPIAQKSNHVESLEMYINPDVPIESHESYTPRTPLEWAEQALLQANSKPTKAIAQMELLRGVELRADRKEINLFQPQNCEAALAYSRGQVRNDIHACRDCRRRRGPFEKCVILDGYLKKSCSNCHYSANGKRCSFRILQQEHTTKNKTEKNNSDKMCSESAKQSDTPTKRLAETKSLTPHELSDDSASELNMNNRIHEQSCLTAPELQWKVRKTQRRVVRTQKLARLHKLISELLEEEVDELNDYIET